MAYADPQTFTINAVPNVLNRTSQGVNSGEFRKDDGLVTFVPSHQYGSRVRRSLRLNHSKIAADPFLSGVNQKYSSSVYLVVDAPLTGYTNAELKQIVDAFTAWATASSSAMITKLLNGES